MNNIVSSVGQFLADEQRLNEEESAVLFYGLEVAISLVSVVSALLLMGFLVGRVYDVVLFLVGFMPIRRTAGGYHASSVESCLVASCGICGIVLWVSQHTSVNGALFILVISSLLVANLAPVEHPNNPQHPARMKILRQRSRGLAAFYVCAIMFFSRIGYHGTTVLALSYAGAAASLAIAAYQKYVKLGAYAVNFEVDEM